jgi:hypothetical protein
LSDGSSRSGRYSRRSRPREETPPSLSEPNSEAPTRVPSAASSTSSSSSTDSHSARPWRQRGTVVCISPTSYSFARGSSHAPKHGETNKLPQHQSKTTKKYLCPQCRIFCPRAYPVFSQQHSHNDAWCGNLQDTLPDDRIEVQLERIRQSARSTVASRMITCAELVEHIKCVSNCTHQKTLCCHIHAPFAVPHCHFCAPFSCGCPKQPPQIRVEAQKA